MFRRLHEKIVLLDVWNRRIKSTKSMEQTHYRERMGIQGEQILIDTLKRDLKVEPIIMYDYRFEVNGKERQIDCLLIFQYECVLIEVKHYKGEYVYNNEVMYFRDGSTKLETQPFMQVESTCKLLTELFKEEDIHMRIKEKVVFTNSEFYMFGDHRGLPVVYPATMKSFLEELNHMHCQISEHHEFIFQKLIARKRQKSKYEVPIECAFSEFHKGITCESCSGWMKVVGRKHFKCTHCHYTESWERGVMRSVHHFVVAFPEDKITVSIITEWIDGIIHKNTVQRILSKNCILIGKSVGSYYQLKENNIPES